MIVVVIVVVVVVVMVVVEVVVVVIIVAIIVATYAPFDTVTYERVCDIGCSFDEQLLHQVPFLVQQEVDQRQLVVIRNK